MPLCLRALIPSTASPRRVQDRVVIMRRLWARQQEGLARQRHVLEADVPYDIMGIFVRVYMRDSCRCLLAVVRFLVAVVVRNPRRVLGVAAGKPQPHIPASAPATTSILSLIHYSVNTRLRFQSAPPKMDSMRGMQQPLD